MWTCLLAWLDNCSSLGHPDSSNSGPLKPYLQDASSKRNCSLGHPTTVRREQCTPPRPLAFPYGVNQKAALEPEDLGDDAVREVLIWLFVARQKDLQRVTAELSVVVLHSTNTDVSPQVLMKAIIRQLWSLSDIYIHSFRCYCSSRSNPKKGRLPAVINTSPWLCP